MRLEAKTKSKIYFDVHFCGPDATSLTDAEFHALVSGSKPVQTEVDALDELVGRQHDHAAVEVAEDIHEFDPEDETRRKEGCCEF